MSSDSKIDTPASLTRINPSYLFDMSALGFSQVTVAEPGRLAFLSGQVAGGSDADMPPDLASQATIVATNLKKLLADLRASTSDVVFIRIYVVNATTARFQEALKPLKATFVGGSPSITTIGVQSLYAATCQLEVEMIVRVP